MGRKHQAFNRFYLLVLMVAAVISAAMFFYGTTLDIRDGVVDYKRGGMTSRTDSPVRFWFNVAIQALMGVAFTCGAIFFGYIALRRRR